MSLTEVAARGLERREVHGVRGPGAGRHGVHAADGPEEALLAHHRPQHRRDGLVRVLVARQRLHPRLQKKGLDEAVRHFRGSEMIPQPHPLSLVAIAFKIYVWNSFH